MILLSRSEEIILLAIWKLKNNAYGVTIKEQISNDTGHDWSFGAIYKPLKKLTYKNYVQKKMSGPAAERGGRSKYLYTLTVEGEAALKEIRKIHKAIWTKDSSLAFD
jgi:PadR family transcriptional regulator, regulatory protein PadR